MFTRNDILKATKNSHQKDVLYAESIRREGFESGKKWYVSVLSESNIQTSNACILEIVGCYETEKEAVKAFCLRIGEEPVCELRAALRIRIRNRHKYMNSIYDNIQFITIRQMRNADDYKCQFDSYDPRVMDLDYLSERPEYIMPAYNDRNYDPYASDEDDDDEDYDDEADDKYISKFDRIEPIYNTWEYKYETEDEYV